MPEKTAAERKITLGNYIDDYVKELKLESYSRLPLSLDDMAQDYLLNWESVLFEDEGLSATSRELKEVLNRDKDWLIKDIASKPRPVLKEKLIRFELGHSAYKYLPLIKPGQIYKLGKEKELILMQGPKKEAFAFLYEGYTDHEGQDKDLAECSRLLVLGLECSDHRESGISLICLKLDDKECNRALNSTYNFQHLFKEIPDLVKNYNSNIKDQARKVIRESIHVLLSSNYLNYELNHSQYYKCEAKGDNGYLEPDITTMLDLTDILLVNSSFMEELLAVKSISSRTEESVYEKNPIGIYRSRPEALALYAEISEQDMVLLAMDKFSSNKNLSPGKKIFFCPNNIEALAMNITDDLMSYTLYTSGQTFTQIKRKVEKALYSYFFLREVAKGIFTDEKELVLEEFILPNLDLASKNIVQLIL